mgnify:CR=1 FL=1
MENQDILISRILNTAPYQLPPVARVNGVYHLDITWRGERLNKLGQTLEEVLNSYYLFVTKRGHILRPRIKEPLADLPSPMGKDLSNYNR